jgi:hypothetical protein
MDHGEKMAEIRQIGKLTIHFLGDNAAQLANSFDNSLSGSRSFRDAMGETARTYKDIYVGGSLEDLRDQPGFDRAGFYPNSRGERDTNAFGKPSGPDNYFIVITNKKHHLTQDGQTFAGSMDLSLVHELLHPTQIIRELTETGRAADDSEARTQMREQRIAEELGRVPGRDFPDVLGSGLPYGVQLESPEAQPPSAPQGDPPLPVDPMKYEGRAPHNPLQRLLLPQTDSRPAPRLVRVNGLTPQALPAMSTASSDNRSSWGDRFGNGISFPQDIPPLNPNLPMPPPENEGPIGIVSGKPMPRWPIPPPIFDTRDNSGTAAGNWLTSALLRDSSVSQPSSLDTNGSQASLAPNGQDSATTAPSDRSDNFAPLTTSSQNSQGPLTLNEAYQQYRRRLDASQSPALAFEPSAPAVPSNPSSIAQAPDDGGPLTLMEAYQQYRKRLDASQPQAPAFDAGAPLVPSDDPIFSGGLVGRLTALMRQYPEMYGSPPQEDDELPSYYGLMRNR